MTTRTEICNLALLHVGESEIADIDDTEPNAVRCRNAFFLMRDATLRAGAWNFAMVTTTLPAETTPPAFGFKLSYVLPTDPFCLRVWTVNEKKSDFKVRGRRIHTDATAPIDLEYIARIEDEGEFDANFIDAFALRIAWAVSYPITRKRALKDELWKLYLGSIQTARTADAHEGTPDDPYDNAAARARL